MRSWTMLLVLDAATRSPACVAGHAFCKSQTARPRSLYADTPGHRNTPMGEGKDAAGTAGVPRGNAREVLAVFLRLGLTSFGGPIAHLGYFHDEFVVRRRWLDEKTYADLVALCQFLPGPASSQVGI